MDGNARSMRPLNRNTLISMVAALLTVLSFCIAVAPIPLTGWVCYPAAAVLGLVALITGIAALAQISHSAENGRSYALIGITVGTLAIVGTACTIAAGIAFFPRFIAFIGEGMRLAEATGHRIVQFFVSLQQSIVR